MADCPKALDSISFKEKFFFEFGIVSNSGGHLDSEQEHLYTCHLVLSLLFSLVYVPFIVKFFKEIRKTDNSDLSFVFSIVNACIILKVISFMFDFFEIHLIKTTGHGSDIIGFVGHGSNYIAQYILCCLLILLACGWTI